MAVSWKKWALLFFNLVKKSSVNCFAESPPLPFPCLLVHSEWGEDLLPYIYSFSADLFCPVRKYFSTQSSSSCQWPSSTSRTSYSAWLSFLSYSRDSSQGQESSRPETFFLPDKVSFRFFWTGQRIEKFYQLLVKDAIKVWVLFFASEQKPISGCWPGRRHLGHSLQ